MDDSDPFDTRYSCSPRPTRPERSLHGLIQTHGPRKHPIEECHCGADGARSFVPICRDVGAALYGIAATSPSRQDY